MTVAVVICICLWVLCGIASYFWYSFKMVKGYKRKEDKLEPILMTCMTTLGLVSLLVVIFVYRLDKKRGKNG